MRYVLLLAFVLACGNKDSGSSTAGSKELDQAKITKATMKVKKYAFECYPLWATAHADKACPSKIAELDEFAEKDAGPDPWGNVLVMKCGSDLPAGAKGIAISSNGPDGKPDTADDIKSW